MSRVGNLSSDPSGASRSSALTRRDLHTQSRGAQSSGSSSGARSGGALLESRQGAYTALPHLGHSTARIASSEPAVYASLLQRFDPERAAMYYGLTPSDFQLVSVCTQACRSGLPNGRLENNCFINSALQCFLRLDIVAKVLRAHKSGHEQRRRRNIAGCAACELADLAAGMHSGTLASASGLVGMVRRGDFGDDFKSVSIQTPSGVDHEHPQCDAPELFFGPEALGGRQPEYLGLVGVLNKWEECGFWGGADVVEARDVNVVDQSRHVLDTYVFGVLMRTRKRCLLCNHVTDSLQEDPFLDLAFHQGESRSTVSVSLVTMLQRELGECVADSDSKCGRREQDGCSGQGSAGIVLQRYIEREPPVLVIRLRRVWRDETGTRKMHARCQFPEKLSCMRTGEYHFAGVILHGGPSTKSGHYRAVTWHGDDRYWLYDDDKDVKPLRWSELERASVQSECYMLIYVRTHFWNGVPGDGSDHTPYARDATSLGYVLRTNSGNDGASSGDVRGGGEHSTSVSMRLRSVLSCVPTTTADEYEEALRWSFEDIAEKFPAHVLFTDLSAAAKEHLSVHVPMYGSWALQNSSLLPLQQLLCRMWQEEIYGLYSDLNRCLRQEACGHSLAYLTSWLHCMVSGAQKDVKSEGLPFVWRATLLPAVPIIGEVISEPWLATTSDRLVAERKVASFLTSAPVGLRGVLLQISTSRLRGMQLPARQVDEKEILCLPGIALRVREVLHQVVDGKEVPVLVVELDDEASTSDGTTQTPYAREQASLLRVQQVPQDLLHRPDAPEIRPAYSSGSSDVPQSLAVPEVSSQKRPAPAPRMLVRVASDPPDPSLNPEPSSRRPLAKARSMHAQPSSGQVMTASTTCSPDLDSSQRRSSRIASRTARAPARNLD